MANMSTGSSLANGNKRVNQAKSQVAGKFNSAFSQGENMATSRSNPTEKNPSNAQHTS